MMSESRIKKSKLRQIIKEEIASILKEDDTEDYSDEFQRYAAKILRGKNVGGWKFSEHDRTGGFEFNKGKYQLFATPFWEDAKGIPIDLMDDEGDFISQDFISMKPTNDFKKDFTSYLKLVKAYLVKLNRKL